MTKRQKRFLVEFPDDITELIIAHPGGHIDVIEVDHGEDREEEAPEDVEEGVAEEPPSDLSHRPRRKR